MVDDLIINLDLGLYGGQGYHFFLGICILLVELSFELPVHVLGRTHIPLKLIQ